MSDKRQARDMGELLQDATYTGILVPVVPDLELRILKTIEDEPERFDMDQWVTECGTAACLAGHACLIAERSGFDLVNAADNRGGYHGFFVGASRWCAFHRRAEHCAIAMWKAIGKEVPDFRTDNAAALADLRARVAADLEAQG